MKPANLLLVSIGLNVALLAAAAVLRLGPTPPPAVAAPVESITLTDERRFVTNLPAATTFVTNRFHWRQLASTNYDEFVANLRAVACPERTLRDLIVGDAWRVYAVREEQAVPEEPFWVSGQRRTAADRRHEAELRALKMDLTATLHRLFGITWSPELERDILEDEQAICRVLLGDVTEEQFERAAALLLSVEELKDDVRWQCRSILLEEDYAELRQRRDAMEQELQAILSPAQFEEFSARASVLELIFRGDALQELKPTAGEMRQIALATTAMRPLGWKILDLDDTETSEQTNAAERNFESRLRMILGEQRFAEFQLLQDGNYRQIRSFTQQQQLPDETTRKLYAIRQLAQEEAKRLRGDPELDAKARTQRLEAMTTDVAREVGALLGPKLLGDYLRQGGNWVTNAQRL